MDDDVRWLDPAEQMAWRQFISATTVVFRELERRLLRAHDLTMDDYAILVLLSESPGRRLRMHEISQQGIIARPQVTYRIRRLEARGIVERIAACSDGRGIEAHLSDAGLELLRRAACDHVRSVRELVLDSLDPDEFQRLGASMQKMFFTVVTDGCHQARRA